jgi:hypothetical protein
MSTKLHAFMTGYLTKDAADKDWQTFKNEAPSTQDWTTTGGHGRTRVGSYLSNLFPVIGPGMYSGAKSGSIWDGVKTGGLSAAAVAAPAIVGTGVNMATLGRSANPKRALLISLATMLAGTIAAGETTYRTTKAPKKVK